MLNEDYRIVGVGPAAVAGFGPLAGRLLWECFPGSEPLFKPYYDQSRESGEPVEFVQFYEGTVARIRAVPTGDQLGLRWERLLHLDTLTLDGLRSSIAEAIELLDDREAEMLRHEMRGLLHVIEGGTRGLPLRRRLSAQRSHPTRRTSFSTTTTVSSMSAPTSTRRSADGSDMCSGITSPERRRCMDPASRRHGPRGTRRSAPSSTLAV